MLVILKEVGYGFEYVVCCGVWFDDVCDFFFFNKVFKEYFGVNLLVCVCVVFSMVVDCKVEVDCVVFKC